MKKDAEREMLYREFKQLGIPVDDFYLLSNLTLKHLLDSIKEAILEYRKGAKLSSDA
ncbi:hypothetical protein [Nitrososphaera viennensis]|uniref:Uncharacterized protein n=2 Tax=Nitrososphaera viennensis TaxID=1034015 RepID=A0A060HI27_9ARCH|nr:hypothetical protein [Nitrososphaera viennensis]AIC15208.1 hypothetical protein NVIE_009800 [Nitrososphaera viennensis EN76]UVS70123.1 hypothetical protein NWT39_04880 [Nitrososphaera viennensis]